jgi:hypothetical protein
VTKDIAEEERNVKEQELEEKDSGTKKSRIKYWKNVKERNIFNKKLYKDSSH